MNANNQTQVKHVPCNGTIYGEDNLMFMANDWHTALLPVYLQVSVCLFVSFIVLLYLS